MASPAGHSPSSTLARMLSRLRKLESSGRINSAEKIVIKERLLDNRSPGNNDELTAAFSAWVDESDESLEISLKALVSSFKTDTEESLTSRIIKRSSSSFPDPSNVSGVTQIAPHIAVRLMQETAKQAFEEQESDIEEHILDGRTPSPEMAGRLMRGVYNRTVLFYAREMESVAIRAQQMSKDRILLGKISWQRFDTPDGWPHLFIENTHDLQFNDVMFLASFHSPLVVFEQISAMYALARYGCRSLRVIVPFFPTGTMERVEVVGEVATAATLARMLSMVPHCAGGPAQYVFLDIHALQEQFYFSDEVIVLLKSCIKLLLKALSRLPSTDKVVIVFPDDGAFKRFNKKFSSFPTVICHKLRLQQDVRVVEIRDGLEFVPGAHCIIVDDLVKSGGTLFECAAVLLKAGAQKVSAYVTHGVFPNDSYKKFFHSSNPKVKFDTFWVTDTIPTVACRLIEPPFKVLSIAPLMSFLRQNFWDTEPQRYD